MNVNLAPFNKLEGASGRQLRDRPQRRGPHSSAARGWPRRSCQVLPPGFPGHSRLLPVHEEPGHEVDAPDIDKAKQLVKESGTAGQRVAVVVSDDEVNKAMGVYVQSVLNDDRLQGDGQDDLRQHPLHLRPEHEEQGPDQRVSSGTRTTRLHRTSCTSCFGCESFHPGSDSSINIAGFCDKQDQRADEGGPRARRQDRGRRERAVDEDRPRGHRRSRRCVTLFTPKHVDFVSKRVGNFTFSKQFYWLVDQSWVQ